MPTRKKQKLGDCYEVAGKFMMSQNPSNSRYLLIHAEVAGQGAIAGVTYGHGFVLDTENDVVIDKSNGRNLEMPAAIYYYVGKISQLNNVHEYTYRQMTEKMLEHENWGPWDLVTSSGY